MVLEFYRQCIYYSQTVFIFIEVPLILPILYELMRNHLIHLNFRIILMVNCLCAFYVLLYTAFHTLELLALIPSGLFPFAQVMQIYTSCASRCCLILLFLERKTATRLRGRYHVIGKGLHKKIFILFGLSPALVLFTIRNFVPRQVMVYLLLAFQVLLPLILYPLLQQLLRENRKIRAVRFHHGMDLLSTYQIEENIRATRAIIPMAIVQFICQVVSMLAYCYCLFFTDVPLGMDTGPISHVFQVTAIVDQSSLFTILLWNLWRSRKKRIALEPVDTDRDLQTKKYFMDLKAQWGDVE